MRLSVWVLSGLLTLLVTYSSAAEISLVLASQEDFKPYEWRDGDQVKGLDVDIVREMGRRLGWKIEIKLYPWKRVLHEIAAGSVDGGFSAFRTREREEYAIFLDPPVHLSTYCVFVNPERPIVFYSLEDLDGKVLGKNLGFSINSEFDHAQKRGRFEVVEKSMSHNLRLLAAQRIDAVIGNELEVDYMARELGLEGKIVALPTKVSLDIPAHLIISRKSPLAKDPEILRQMEDTLQRMLEDGAYAAFLKKYQ
ncbi:ABC-type amino acid transport/signal transduction systems, periplasmic component/domain [Hahella chejuensis KCTC 2396]|uniref:ABC-type amino acid transport/signal transduction systems, periplasmic component/domain n=1 Tax=Hahella chejuensis (strain KCTC 2396) TaxID=349521 RepID=Q2S720_HAHCH|nr:transporter substrate-binding domain-containing protein [Hahella chejuensis]ABC33554.1 ABC-type amino acid transport/signal transduction systems, periplasmic component/domain [Hahella chejuensis KCTC 2396]